jgi:hypothetical protein
MPLAEVGSSWGALLLMAGAIALVFSLGRLLKKLARRGGQESGAADAGDGDGSARRMRGATDACLAEIESAAREAGARLETRIRVLNELLLRAEALQSRLGEKGTPAAPSRFAEVYRLADDGLDPAEIAARTDFERGEVDLILSLRRREADAPGGVDAGGRGT